MSAVIDLVTGFLGAGKTTFIKRYVSALERAGARCVVVENEFGAAGTDGALLKGAGRSVRELTGGCICCGLKVGFHDLLRDLAASGGVDRIVVEPSGIFDPDDYFDVVESPDVRERARTGALVCVVDPDFLDAQEETLRRMLFAQLCSATDVLISKLTAPEAFDARIRRVLREGGSAHAPRVTALPWAQMPDAFLTEEIAGRRAARLPHERVRLDHAALFNATAVRPRRAFAPEEIAAAARRCVDGSCGEVLRVKGFVRAAGGGMWQVSGTPGRVDVTPAPPEAPSGLNVIGRKLQRAALRAVFA